MTCLAIIIVSIVAVLLTTWAALIVESLATGGTSETYFDGDLDWTPDLSDESECTFILKAVFGFVDSNGEHHDAPIGMVTDGASVGSLFRWPVIGWLTYLVTRSFPTTGKLQKPSVPHDLIYGSAVDRSFWRALISMRRAVGDRVIYEAAMCPRIRVTRNGVSYFVHREPLAKWRAFVVMALLRVAGVGAWMSDASKAQQSLRQLVRQ